MTKNSLFAAALGLSLLGFGCGPKPAPTSPSPSAPPPTAQQPAPTTAPPTAQKPTKSPDGTQNTAYCEYMISVKDVERLTGVSPLQVIPYELFFAGGTCNFGPDAKTVALLVSIFPDNVTAYANGKKQYDDPGDSVEVTGIGDEAFFVNSAYSLYVRKGNTTVVVQSYAKASGERFFTLEQLKAVAASILPKL